MADEERREMMRNNYAAQMEMLGYQSDGSPKDLVEVVRCKNCKHRLKCDYWLEKGDDWYCGDGENEQTGGTRMKPTALKEKDLADLERATNGILCAASPICQHCDFSCPKWIGYSVDKAVAVIREILNRRDAILQTMEKEADTNA